MFVNLFDSVQCFFADDKLLIDVVLFTNDDLLSSDLIEVKITINIKKAMMPIQNQMLPRYLKATFDDEIQDLVEMTFT